MRLRGFALIGVLALAVSACSDDTVTGDVVSPLEGPRIIEAQLALEVVDGAPAGITDIFAVGEFVNLWVHWDRLEPPHEVESVWWDPLDNFVATTLDITENVPEQVTVFTLELIPVSVTGRWEVEIYVDGEFMRSIIFNVISDF